MRWCLYLPLILFSNVCSQCIFNLFLFSSKISEQKVGHQLGHSRFFFPFFLSYSFRRKHCLALNLTVKRFLVLFPPLVVMNGINMCCRYLLLNIQGITAHGFRKEQQEWGSSPGSAISNYVNLTFVFQFFSSGID